MEKQNRVEKDLMMPRGVERIGSQYSAGITIMNKFRSLGSFDTVDEAKHAFEEARAKFRK